jgi:STE24 endopeptidase
MTPTLFAALFLFLLGLMLAAELWLTNRHIRYVDRHRHKVPRWFQRRISVKAHRRSADYTVAKARFSRIESLYGAALLLGWTLGGGLALADDFWRSAGWGPVATGVAFLLSVMLLMTLLELPVTAYQAFGIEHRFGFNRMTVGLFIGDTVKHLLIAFIIGLPIAWAALALMTHAGPYWWLWVWLLWMGFTLFMVWAYPTLIAPLFNRFRVLRDKALRDRLTKLLERTGFHSRGIYVVDSSQRTTHGNAYFTGFGASKRIVFFDSLLKRLRPAEVEAVVAHELGHFKLGHILKRLVMMALMSLAGLWLLGRIIDQPWFYQGLGVAQGSPHAALVLFMLAGPVFTFFLQPLYAWGSRRHEFQADDFAARQTNPRLLVSALVKLYRDNAATLTPDPVYSAFHDSHPPALRRITALLGRRGSP